LIVRTLTDCKLRSNYREKRK